MLVSLTLNVGRDQAVGAGVPELSAAFSLAIEMGARLEDIAAHPGSPHTERELP